MSHERRIGQETNTKGKSEWDDLADDSTSDFIEQLSDQEQQANRFDQPPSEL